MNAPDLLSRYFTRLDSCAAARWQGRVTQVIGQLVESEGPCCSVGELCQIVSGSGRIFPGEVIGFRKTTVLSMPLERPRGIRYGDQVVTWGARPTLRDLIAEGKRIVLDLTNVGFGFAVSALGGYDDTLTLGSNLEHCVRASHLTRRDRDLRREG